MLERTGLFVRIRIGSGSRLGNCRLVLLEQREAFENQHVHVGGQEAAISVFVVEDDRLTAHVEAGVDDDRAAGLRFKGFEQTVVASVSLGIGQS